MDGSRYNIDPLAEGFIQRHKKGLILARVGDVDLAIQSWECALIASVAFFPHVGQPDAYGGEQFALGIVGNTLRQIQPSVGIFHLAIHPVFIIWCREQVGHGLVGLGLDDRAGLAMECHRTHFCNVGFIGQVVAQDHGFAFKSAGNCAGVLGVVGNIQWTCQKRLEPDFRHEIDAMTLGTVADDFDSISGSLERSHATEGKRSQRVDADFAKLCKFGVKVIGRERAFGEKLLKFCIKKSTIIRAYDEKGGSIGFHKLTGFVDREAAGGGRHGRRGGGNLRSRRRVGTNGLQHPIQQCGRLVESGLFHSSQKPVAVLEFAAGMLQ